MLLECKYCGYKWNGSKRSRHCPNCDRHYFHESDDEGAVCGLDGGDCDICGCHFITGLLQAHHCPNCGSKEWDGGKPQPKMRIPNVWTRDIVKTTKNGPKTYTYWMATWREGGKTRNVHLGSCEKLSQSEALQKARAMKAKALGIEL